MFKIFLVVIIAATALGLCVYAYFAWKSPRRQICFDRFIADMKLLWKQALHFAICSFIIGYFQSIFGRNLAFYLHHPLADYVKDPDENLLRPRLYDLGHALLPDHSDSESLLSLNEFLQYCMATGLILTSLFPYWRTLRSTAPPLNIYTTNVILRLMTGVAVGHILRMPTFLSTSLPGPSPHCIGEIERENRPRDLAHIFWYPHMGANCGDLVFSGHILFATTAFWTVVHYMTKAAGPKVGNYCGLALAPVFVAQIVVILMSRAHYTVDIVSSLIISTLSWMVQARVYWRHDAKPTDWDPRPDTATNDEDVPVIVTSGSTSESDSLGSSTHQRSTAQKADPGAVTTTTKPRALDQLQNGATLIPMPKFHSVTKSEVGSDVDPELVQVTARARHSRLPADHMATETPRRGHTEIDAELPSSRAQSTTSTPRKAGSQVHSKNTGRASVDTEFSKSIPATPVRPVVLANDSGLSRPQVSAFDVTSGPEEP